MVNFHAEDIFFRWHAEAFPEKLFQVGFAYPRGTGKLTGAYFPVKEIRAYYFQRGLYQPENAPKY